ncbi:MAG: SpoIID/LytB domain-containing protein [Endomicrobium sp.]|nr:SpoIID/LytB domain-containing protein [Endomicrobium sp.]
MINVSSVKIGSSGIFFVVDSMNNKLQFSKDIILEAIYMQSDVKIVDQNGAEHFINLPIKIISDEDIICVNCKPYRGYLELYKSINKINVINVLDIDNYVKGVLIKEMGMTKRIEALKVQAIISRTYAFVNFNKHQSQGFNVCSTTHCQVYGGIEVETIDSNKAVSNTRDEVLLYNEQLAETVYHANCGGHTDSPKYIWKCKNDVPNYLKGVKCGFCDDNPHTKWMHVMSKDFIKKKLMRNNIIIGEIENIRINNKTQFGTTESLEILHSDGSFIINSYEFRIIVDSDGIKSHDFDSVEIYDNKVYFKGKGYGHKVGLCQCGAIKMAENGMIYNEILSHFYPDTKIEKILYE